MSASFKLHCGYLIELLGMTKDGIRYFLAPDGWGHTRNIENAGRFTWAVAQGFVDDIGSELGRVVSLDELKADVSRLELIALVAP